MTFPECVHAEFTNIRHGLVSGGKVKEDDLTIDAQIELDVRDAPLRSVSLDLPAGFLVAAVQGKSVADHRVLAGAGGRELEIKFAQPLLERAILVLRLERGRGSLGAAQPLQALSVRGAKHQRGHLVLVAAEGIQIDVPQGRGLREVHVGSVPFPVADAQYAYRFRTTEWTLPLLARRKPADIGVDMFHVISVGEGLIYGGAAANYFISGSPVDQLQFRVP